MKAKDKVFISVGSLALLATFGFGGYSIISSGLVGGDDAKPATNSDVTTNTTDSNTTTVVPVVDSAKYFYKDGSYSAVASYSVPRGSNSLTVNVTIKNDIIEVVTTSHNYTDGDSEMYTDSFDSQLSSAVVGKSLNGLSISRIGGASLTTSGFDEALSIIRTNASV